MTSWLFVSDVEGWSGFNVGWISDQGSPDVGCIGREYSDAATTGISISGQSISVSPGDAISFRFRVIGANPSCGYVADASMVCYDSLSNLLGFCEIVGAAMPGYDSGWLEVSGTISTGGTIDTINLAIGCGFGQSNWTAFYYDSVYIAESPAASLNDFRYLRMTADNTNLYVTGIEDNNLTHYVISQSSLTIIDSDTFGTANYTAPDSFSYGIFPVIHPTSDRVVFLYGRDGNNKQVQYNDFNGTLGWINIGAGTATWATSKYCVGLFPALFNPDDIIAVFYDDDIYQTYEGTANWIKMGDADTGVRVAMRSDFESQKLLMAGTAAGIILLTQNYGISSDTAGTAAGTINAVILSR